MAQARKKIDPTVQERLRVMAAELRGLVYGEPGCPEWGTKFAEIEADGMSVGLELARLVMEQTAQQQADEMPDEALQFEGETVLGVKRLERLTERIGGERVAERDAAVEVWRRRTIFERHFGPYGFVPILDFIHALTYVYAAAMSGRMPSAGWPVYVRWITWVWQGEVPRVILELAARQQELGLPTDNDGPTSPRQIVSNALTYLQNQKSRMNYPQYRRAGLPITSSHVESTNKQLNRRVKGTEKFSSRRGAEAMLQLKADTLSDTAPLDQFWRNRPQQMNGCRHYSRSTT